MTTKTPISNRLLSIFLCLALLLSILPTAIQSASAAPEDATRVSDPSTMDDWKDLFLPADGSLNTENAGGVWTDKSVFTDATAFGNTGITMKRNDSFLVALSAMASNMTVTGMSHVPTDTMLVLDVSGSMNDNRNNNDVAEELVDAANASVHALLTANSFNRVGIVLYSDKDNDTGHSVLLLPLGRYKTDSDNQYVNYNLKKYWDGSTTESVSLDPDTVIEGTTRRPASTGKTVVGGTFIQNGLALAKNQFVVTSNETTIYDPVLGALKRKPVLVLMSDGAPTYGCSDFTDPADDNMGSGGGSSSALGFVTQLTAAWVKNRIEEKYDTKCLFYTLGLGTGSNSVATSVLNPKNTSANINTFWTRYNNAKVGDEILVQDADDTRDTEHVIKIEEPLNKEYVDRYFDSSQYTSSGSLAEALKNAFAAIVDDIQLQSKYYPTLISANEDLSGYISFVDKVGQYMNVTDIKGILIDNTLYSGADLARNFAAGSNGGALGTVTSPTSLGDEMVWAIQARLGLATTDEARTLITLAYQYGQLSYTSPTEFSNYIGWYANAQGKFLGFWHEGITTMPDPNDPTLTDETRPVYIMKSYGYLGAVDEEQGVAASDMMYATVQLRTEIATGEQTVAFAVPAALIPIVTYNVSLSQTGALTNLTATGAQHPIRLVYEVALDKAIDEFTLTELVSPEYLAQHTAPDGSVSFYTNQYEVDNSTGYGKVNTYSYFNPSRQNDRYYYLENALIYTDTSGTLYTGATKPTGQMYRRHVVYIKDGQGLAIRTGYHPITADALATAQRTEGANTWYIPQGNVRVDLEEYAMNKSENTTGTLPQSNVPFVDTHDHTLGDTGHSFIVGATLGNNGKITVMPTTGIRLTKSMTAGVTAPDAPFTFYLTNLTNPRDNTTYPGYKVSATGEKAETTVAFTAGKATITLMAGETLYIGGMIAGQTILVSEEETVDYKVASVNGDTNANAASIILEAGLLSNAEFVNTLRGKGNLSIAKEVEHDFGQNYQIPADKQFTITVTLTGVGTANATFEAKQDNATFPIETDADGKFTITLAHNEQIEIVGLPEGTVATVVEQDPGAGFTAQYWEGTQLDDGVVTVIANTTVSVIVHNNYTAEKVYPVNITVSGTKILTGRQWQDDDSFSFQLQRQIGENDWFTLDTQTIYGTDPDHDFDFNGTLAEEEYATAGTYYYRIIEIEPEGDLDGITYDKTVHSFSVDVGDLDMDGSLEIIAVRASRPDNTVVTQPTEDSWHVAATFTNSYKATGSVTVTIDLNKKVINPSGSHLALLSGFAFELVDENGIVQFTSQPTTDRGFSRLVLTYEAAGTYHYTLREVTPDPIPDGWTYSSIEIPVTVVVTDTGDGHFTAQIYQGTTAPETAGTSISVDFTNEYIPDAVELPIDFAEKHLTGRDLIPGEFTFEVRNQNGDTLLTGTNDAAGKITFSGTLKFDKVGTYFFHIVEVGTDGNGVTHDKHVYQVTVTVTDVGGKLAVSYELVSVAGDTIVFQNTYTAKEVTHSITGSKVLTGRVLMNEEFTFVLTEAMDAQGNIAEGAKRYEVSNFTNGTFRFPAITYTAAGTYYYVVSEMDGGSNFGIRYDKTAYIVTIVVVDDGLGQLVVDQVTYTIQGGEDAQAITFTNAYVANPTEAQVTGDKQLDGKVLNGGDFRFQLYTSNENWELGQLVEEVANDANGNFSFQSLPFDKAGTYYYLVKELHGGETIDGITYDSTIYRVEIRITDDLRGQLHAEILTYDHNDIPQEGILFENIYRITGTDSVTLSGSKDLTGRDILDGEFTFQLFQTDETFTVTGEALQEVTNAGAAFSFLLNYTGADAGNTYYYVVREMNGDRTINGVAYDNGEYHITVVVTDNGIGGITTETTIVKDGITQATLAFTNHYTANPTTADITGTKVLEGKELVAGQFGFDLIETDETYTPIPGVQTIRALIKADGTFAFETLTFTEAGTYHYIVLEQGAGQTINGITYDGTIYRVEIQVTDDGLGQLHAQVTLTDATGAEKEAIHFHNEYTITGTDSVTLSGNKDLTGRDILDGEFTFQLFKTDETFTVTGEALQEVTNADGAFSFLLNYTGADAGNTYYYVVREMNGGQTINGVEYDSGEYHITVVITDNGIGGITTETTITKDSITQATLNFTNHYSANSTTVDITGTKILDGKELVADQFGFDLIEADATYTPIPGAQAIRATVKADGTFAFEPLTFTEAGTYHYIVQEQNAGQTIDGITYDDTVYHVEIRVTDDGLGHLHAQVTLTDATGAEQEALQFHNKYTITGTDSVTIGGSKELTGRDMIDGEFTFQLFQTDETFTVTGEPIMEAGNLNGIFSMTLDYTAEDAGNLYHYVLREKNAGQTINGITFSDAEYHISIHVFDDGIGGIGTEVSIQLGESSVTSTDFTNHYQADSTTATISGTKTLTGRALVEGEFRFLLTPATSNFEAIEGATVLETTNRADGSFTFADLVFTEAGTYHYILTEDDTVEAQHIVFDKTVYHVTIEVTDNGQGKLIASQPVIVKKGSTEAAQIAFQNAFVEPPPKTGESIRLSMLMALLFISGTGLTATAILGKKKREDA